MHLKKIVVIVLSGLVIFGSSAHAMEDFSCEAPLSEEDLKNYREWAQKEFARIQTKRQAAQEADLAKYRSWTREEYRRIKAKRAMNS